MLALSVQLARYPWNDDLAHKAEARSSICGSSIAMGLDLDKAGLVERIGMTVSACAVGQSSAAILASAAHGKSADDIERTLAGIERWLGRGAAGLGQRDLPAWPDLDVIAGARGHPGRHGALLLPWQAAVSALSVAQTQG